MTEWIDPLRKRRTILDLGLRGKLVTEIDESGEVPTVEPERPSEAVLRAMVGRPVHYVSHGSPDGVYESTCRAAWITQASARNDGACALMVANPTGLFFPVSTYDPDGAAGTWHYPETV